MNILQMLSRCSPRHFWEFSDLFKKNCFLISKIVSKLQKSVFKITYHGPEKGINWCKEVVLIGIKYDGEARQRSACVFHKNILIPFKHRLPVPDFTDECIVILFDLVSINRQTQQFGVFHSKAWGKVHTRAS